MSGETTRKAVHELHNKSAGEIVKQIVRPTIEAGGEMTDVLVLLESVVTGVCMVAIRTGGDNFVLDKLIEGVRLRLAEQRLAPMPTAGSA